MSTTTPAYVPGTSLEAILTDGWSRDFKPAQTVSEASSMGFTITEDEVLAIWADESGMINAFYLIACSRN